MLRKILILLKIPIKKIIDFWLFLWKLKFSIFTVGSLLCVAGAFFVAPILLPFMAHPASWMALQGFIMILFLIVFSVALDRIAETIGVGLQAIVILKNAINALRSKIDQEILSIRSLGNEIRNGTQKTKELQEELETLLEKVLKDLF